VSIRIGNGYDIHKLVPRRKLILGAAHLECELSLLGHSVADAVLHALSDAIFGALALPDIGTHFPDTDPGNKNIDSKIILLIARNKLSEWNFQISNVDITIIAEVSKLPPFVEKIRASIAEILGIQRAQVGIKATTNEGLRDIGKKKP
jgi:2-C-methyl-D-erythritol 2,4-cyclodiphosphate synthase